MTTTQLRSLNDIGSRLKWVRESLGITKSKVALDNMMAISSYSDRENGIRTHYPEEYKALAEYFAH
ncbi:MAG: helix-turn-helix transcriptional regulator, partial [Candidatus Pacebacteria bacterium]|nr:helix-turn-helix transcriptional regulator [Candidatus Paceibacterota bacterium]